MEAAADRIIEECKTTKAPELGDELSLSSGAYFIGDVVGAFCEVHIAAA